MRSCALSFLRAIEIGTERPAASQQPPLPRVLLVYSVAADSPAVGQLRHPNPSRLYFLSGTPAALQPFPSLNLRQCIPEYTLYIYSTVQ